MTFKNKKHLGGPSISYVRKIFRKTNITPWYALVWVCTSERTQVKWMNELKSYIITCNLFTKYVRTTIVSPTLKHVLSAREKSLSRLEKIKQRSARTK